MIKLLKTRLKIGYSVQGTALFPHMNVYDNITLLARLNNWSKNDIEERVTKLMSLVNLPTDFRKNIPTNFQAESSSGSAFAEL